MADAQALYAEGIGTTAATTAWVDVCTISAASFTANKKYLLLASCYLNQNNSANELRVRLVHGSTPTVFTDSSAAYEVFTITGPGNRTCYGYFTVFTQPGTTEDVKLQISNSSTSTTEADLGQIFALNLDDVGTQGTDWFWTEVTTDYTTTAAFGDTSSTEAASATFTPNGSDKWLVLVNGVLTPAATNSNYGMSWYDSVLNADEPTLDVEGEDTTNEIRSHMLARTYTPSNASHTVQPRFKHESVAHTIQSSRVFALNLAKFAQAVTTYTAADQSPAATPSWTTTATLSPTPSATGNWFILASWVADMAAQPSTEQLASRLQINASGGGLASNPNYGDDAPACDSWDPTDETPQHIFKMLSLSSGAARDINLDVQAVVGTAATAQFRHLVAFSVALAGGGTQYPLTVAGSLTSSGLLVKQDNKVLAGAMTSSGLLVKQTAQSEAGSVTSSGLLVKQGQKVLDGSLTDSGTLVNQGQKNLAGTLTSAASLVKHTATSFAGTLTDSGLLVKETLKVLAGSLTSSATISNTKVTLISLAGALTSSATLVKETLKNFAGSLTDSGSLTKQTQQSESGALTSSATLVKQTLKNLAGTLTSSGDNANTKVSLLSLAGTLTSAATLVKQTLKTVAGALTSAGSVTKQTAQSEAGSLTSNGALTKQTAATVTGSLPTSGSLTKQTQQSESGSLTSSGSLTKQVQAAFSGALTSAGGLVKQVGKFLSGLWDAVGTFTGQKITGGGTQYPLPVAGTLAMAGTLTVTLIPGTPDSVTDSASVGYTISETVTRNETISEAVSQGYLVSEVVD